MSSGTAEEFVIDVTAKFNDETGKGAAAVDKEISKLSKDATAYGQAMDKARQKAKNLEEEQRKLTQRLQEARGKYNEVKSKADTYRNGVDALKQRLKDLNSQQKGVSEGIKSVQDRLKSATSSVKGNNDETARLTNTLKQLRQQHTNLNSSISATKERISADTTALNGYAAGAKKSYQALGELLSKSKQLNQEMEQNKRTLNENASAYTKVAQEQLKLRQQNSASSDVIAQKVQTVNSVESGKALTSAGKSINGLGTKLTLGLTTPIVTTGIAAIKKGNDFEAQMSRVKAISGATESEFEKLSNQAVKLGADTSYSATEVAEGMENLASAGFTVNEITAAMPGMLNLAASSGEDLANSADIAASTLRGFGLAASQSGHVADVLAQNAAKTNAAVADTGLAMKYIAPVAKNAGWSLESVTAAIGEMADSGIKGEQAGTTLRGALTNLMDPSKEQAKAMSSLGFSAYDAHGKMKPLSQIIGELSQKTKSLSDQQRDQKIATIMGTDALSGMQVLLKDGKSNLDNLTASLVHSDGASEDMANTMLDNTKGSIEQMNGSLETAAITIQKTLAPTITEAANKVTELSNAFAELSPNTQKGLLATVAGIATVGPILKGVGGTLSTVGKIKEFFGKHAASSAVAEVGTEAVKSASKTSLLTKVISGAKNALGLIPLPLKLITAGAGVAGVAIKKWHDYCVNDNLQKHFGDVQLSMEEVEDVAKRLTTNKWTMQVDTVVKNQEKITDLESDLKSNLEEINKTEWKVSVGLKLTDDEKTGLKESVSSYVSNAIKVVEQQHYTAKLAIDTVFTPGTAENTNATTYANSLYGGMSSEIQRLGTSLAQMWNDAFKDGIINDDEIQKIVKKLEQGKQKIQSEMNKLEKARADVEMQDLQSDALKGGLSEDSFSKLLDEENTQLESQKKSAKEAAKNAKVQSRVAYNDHKISKSAYDKQIDKIDSNTDKQLGTNTANALGNAADTIKSNYSKEYSGVESNFASSFKDFLKKGTTDEDGHGVKWGSFFSSIESQIKSSGIQGDSASAIQKLTQKLQPMTSELLGETDAWLKNKQSIPKAVSSQLEKTFQMEVMAGDTSHADEYTGMQMGKSNAYLKMLENAKKSGVVVPEGIIKGAEISSGKTFSNGAFVDAEKATALASDKLNELFKKMGVNAKSSFATNFAGQLQPEVQASISSLLSGITGKQSGTELKNLFKNANIDISDGLASAISKTKPEVQTKLSGLIAGLFSGIQLDTGNLKSVFGGLNVGISDGIASSLAGLSPEIQQGLISAVESTNPQAALSALQQKFSDNATLKGLKIDTDSTGKLAIEEVSSTLSTMNTMTGGATLTGPTMGAIQGVTSAAQAALAKAKAELAGTSLTMHAKIAVESYSAGARPSSGPQQAGVGYTANGDIKTKPTLTWVAEAGYPEAIIPFDPARRQRALGLWKQTGEALGVKPQYHAAGGIVGGQLPQRRNPQEVFALQQTAVAAAPVVAAASGVGMNLGGVQIIVQGGDGDIVKVIAAHKQEIAEAVAEVVNGAMDSANVPMAQGE